ncbi:radical SAM protein [Treponema sp. OttesenSCG-928-L16]|nr:radical SAM protein [Treponema sp. OttesenSCG-928-L16]
MIYLIQPPFVQLNAPYPSLYYLKSFLNGQGLHAEVRDHSIGLFERIFSKPGLEKIFAGARTAYYEGTLFSEGQSFPVRNLLSSHEKYMAERFLSEEHLWINSIDRLVDFLRGRDREFAHLLALANGILPGGPRTGAFLESVQGRILPDEAPLMASAMLADMADFITALLDPSFSLIRYAEHLGASVHEFEKASSGTGGYILQAFYLPYLLEEWEEIRRTAGRKKEGKLFFLFTLPFPGCLSGALLCAESAKRSFGSEAVCIAGGGYVNTELRTLEDPAFFDYFDYLCFDRGYGALAAVLDHVKTGEAKRGRGLYKTMYRKKNAVIAAPDISGPVPGPEEYIRETESYRTLDEESVKTVFPDYRELDFSRYICPVDDENPMHRLWSDGRWLKAYLAHGCYWKSCAFCDVTLDYIRGFEPVDPDALFRHLLDQAGHTGVRAVHLADEAAPLASLIRLAELNRDAGLPLLFWGNIRFEKGFTSDAAALLAAGGLLGVSAGIEVASEKGLKRLGKGIGLDDVVSACAAFKEAGILTHAYLIYGYWDEDEQEIMDSAEILRQMFSQGLLDSAFWHKFILTRHSRIYREWTEGRHRDLKVIDRAEQDCRKKGIPLFADNDLSFEGEERFDPFDDPLNSLLASWMAGHTEDPVEAAFPFKLPSPSISPDLITELLDGYARDRDKTHAALPNREEPGNKPRRSSGISGKRLLFLGSKPILKTGINGTEPDLFWRWKLEDRSMRIRQDDIQKRTSLGSGAEKSAEKVLSLLEGISAADGRPDQRVSPEVFYQALAELLGPKNGERAWKKLRTAGLIIY